MKNEKPQNSPKNNEIQRIPPTLAEINQELVDQSVLAFLRRDSGHFVAPIDMEKMRRPPSIESFLTFVDELKKVLARNQMPGEDLTQSVQLTLNPVDNSFSNPSSNESLSTKEELEKVAYNQAEDKKMNRLLETEFGPDVFKSIVAITAAKENDENNEKGAGVLGNGLKNKISALRSDDKSEDLSLSPAKPKSSI